MFEGENFWFSSNFPFNFVIIEYSFLKVKKISYLLLFKTTSPASSIFLKVFLLSYKELKPIFVLSIFFSYKIWFLKLYICKIVYRI